VIFVPWIAHAGLALSIGLGACANAILLYWGLRRRGIYHPQKGWGIFLVRLLGALFLLAGVALWAEGHFNWLALQAEPLKRVGALVLILLVCAVTYFGSLLAMGFRFGDFRRISA
jgi:putative peptidoglycan lipid II flippase